MFKVALDWDFFFNGEGEKFDFLMRFLVIDTHTAAEKIKMLQKGLGTVEKDKISFNRGFRAIQKLNFG